MKIIKYQMGQLDDQTIAELRGAGFLPIECREVDRVVIEDEMTLRDHFAAKAMQMMRGDLSIEFIAARSYEMADAMLKERNKS